MSEVAVWRFSPWQSSTKCVTLRAVVVVCGGVVRYDHSRIIPHLYSAEKRVLKGQSAAAVEDPRPMQLAMTAPSQESALKSFKCR
jgi:hypothetical protein